MESATFIDGKGEFCLLHACPVTIVAKKTATAGSSTHKTDFLSPLFIGWS
jgi:hypothetical protein